MLELLKKTVSRGKSGHSYSLYRCHCGNEKIVADGNVNSGEVRSCGCLKRLQSRINGSKSQTHGMKRTKEYRMWINIKQRCINPKSQAYDNYGGRGISICNHWLKFENFYADMGKRPEGLSIDRIDNNGNYEPGNCKWSTAKEQRNNQRNKVLKLINNA